MSYRFFRNSLIKVAILSLGVGAIFYDALTGKNVGSPAGLILLAAVVVVGNGWLTYMMLKAKKREQEMAQGGGPAQALKPAVPVTRAQRKRQRVFSLVFLFAAGLGLVIMGLDGWRFDFIPAYYLGAVFGVFGIVGLCGINIWKGGPYDPALDPRNPEPQVFAQSGEVAPTGVWPPPPNRPSA